LSNSSIRSVAYPDRTLWVLSPTQQPAGLG